VELEVNQRLLDAGADVWGDLTKSISVATREMLLGRTRWSGVRDAAAD